MSTHVSVQRKAPPRENICRAIKPGAELRQNGPGVPPTLTGHFAVFNQWTEIDSLWEGTFLERIAPGAMKKTFEENRDGMQVLFQHGQDPAIGDKPLGPIETLTTDRTGAYYEVPLLETQYVRELIPGLEAGLYGASFRFQVIQEELVDRPEPSAYNPRGLPERTIKECKVLEFGPCTFPAYKGATAGVRSITDQYVEARMAERSRLHDEAGGSVIIADMIDLGMAYVVQGAPDAAAMSGVLTTLRGLRLTPETTEAPPAEGPDDKAAEPADAPSTTGAAERTPDPKGREPIPSSWPKVPREEFASWIHRT